MRSKSLVAAAFAAVLALPAIAQNPPASPPTRIRGTVEKLDGNALTVKSREGEEVTVTLAPNVTIRYLVKKSLADIKDGDFVASTSVKGTDGKNHSVELRIFPEAMRGVGEGQYPWDLSSGSLMTTPPCPASPARPKAKP